MTTVQKPYRQERQRYEPPRRSNRGWIIAVVLLGAALLGIFAWFFAGALIHRWDLERHPLHHPDLVKQYADAYDLDAYEVMAMIQVESGGRAQAVSGAGAVGLMQVMPATGEWIADKLGEIFDVERLKDPETNIRYGCWYLRFLHDRFSVDNTVWAAYNRGHNKVREWLEDAALSADGVSLIVEDIPARETRDYVAKMRKNYDKYKELYPDGLDAAESTM